MQKKTKCVKPMESILNKGSQIRSKKVYLNRNLIQLKSWFFWERESGVKIAPGENPIWDSRVICMVRKARIANYEEIGWPVSARRTYNSGADAWDALSWRFPVLLITPISG